MPWLAPIGTPAESGAIESQVPIWQSIRASVSVGSAFTRGSPCVSIASPFAAGDRGGHADLAHDRRLHRRRLALADPDRVDALDGRDIVGKANLHRLGA